MAKYRVINSSPEKMEDLARICFNLRLYSKIWKEHYGATNRANMAIWEKRLDEFLEKYIELDDESGLEPDLDLKTEKWVQGYRDW